VAAPKLADPAYFLPFSTLPVVALCRKILEGKSLSVRQMEVNIPAFTFGVFSFFIQ
jgi:hypothetical protein